MLSFSHGSSILFLRYVSNYFISISFIIMLINFCHRQFIFLKVFPSISFSHDLTILPMYLVGLQYVEVHLKTEYHIHSSDDLNLPIIVVILINFFPYWLTFHPI